jgi:hypothetical protein
LNYRALKVPGASQAEELSEAPGAGQMVTIVDPDGFLVNVIFGQERRKDASIAPADKLRANYPIEKQRLRQFNRFEPGPAAVHKVS